MNVAGARENVGSLVVQQSGIQCFNCKEFGHFSKECRKPKRVKDSAYHKEKMLLCKQAEQGVPLQDEKYDWLEDMDEEIDEQELEAHYSYMAKIQEVHTADSGTDSEPLEQTEFEKYKAFNDRTVDYDKLECKLNETLGQLAQKDLEIKEAGSRDRPPMLATEQYPQWRSRFLRYIDIRPNGDALRKCILSGPYKPTTVLVQAVAATDDSLAIPEHTIIETPMNMSPENKAHFEAEKEAIHLILTRA
nr:hypothetical protein [Tanacetum cinerariifolium]